MSIESWRQEFYAVPADEVPEAEATAHSLRKWQGLREENLKRHGLVRDVDCIREAGSLLDSHTIYINSTTCALCHHYAGDHDGSDCRDCPLFKVRGNNRCDGHHAADGDWSPYGELLRNGDPEPMILWLVKAETSTSIDAAAELGAKT